MRIALVALTCLTCSVNALFAAEAGDVDLNALVDQLGHPVYEERLDARRRLALQGLAAFDVLRAAKEDLDPEIADACQRLLAEMATELVRSDDPPMVREWLAAYATGEIGSRLEVVAGLASLSDEQAVPALVRIARFAPTDRVAREAARALLSMPDDQPSARHQDAIAVAVDALNVTYGTGQRPASQWLELAASEANDAGSPMVADRWRAFAEDGQTALESPRGETSLRVVATLTWRWLFAALNANDTQGATEAINALVTLDEDAALVRLSRGTRWAASAERWPVVDSLVEAHAELLNSKRGKYLLADLAERRGDSTEADRLAAEALATSSDGDSSSVLDVLLGPRVTMAGELQDAGRTEWCIAEYREAAKSPEPLDGRAGVAAWKLANLLFDAERYQEAAEALTPIATAVNQSRALKAEYMQLPQVQRRLLPEAGTLIARQRFSLALAARETGDRKTEMAELRKAITADPNDADVLIAMYRVEDPPVAFAADTRRRIAAKRRDFESEIWSKPTRADAFNQWAWLVANTEGDFEKAVRYSRRSLEIEPGTAGLLDTLGRCLFSAGRIDEAIATQRRAVELQPQMLVLQRQLAQFEAAAQASSTEDAQ